MRILNNRFVTIQSFKYAVNDKQLFIKKFAQFMSSIEIDAINNMNDYSKVAKEIGGRINEGTANMIKGEPLEPIGLVEIQARIANVTTNFNESLVYMHSDIYDPVYVAGLIKGNLDGLKITLTPNQFVADTTVVAINEMIEFMSTPAPKGLLDTFDSVAETMSNELTSINDKLDHLTDVAGLGVSIKASVDTDVTVANESGMISNLVSALSRYKFNTELLNMNFRISTFEDIVATCDVTLSKCSDLATLGKLADMSGSEQALLSSLIDNIHLIRKRAIKTRNKCHSHLIGEIKANEQLVALFDRQTAILEEAGK